MCPSSSKKKKTATLNLGWLVVVTDPQSSLTTDAQFTGILAFLFLVGVSSYLFVLDSQIADIIETSLEQEDLAETEQECRLQQV